MSETALDIGHAKQLLIDDFVIDEISGGAKRVLHQPTKYPGNPVIVGDNPWERGAVFLLGGGGVSYDSRRKMFQMWYRIDFEDPEFDVALAHAGNTVYLAAYAESSCGCHWSKPSLGQRELLGSRENNLLGVGKNMLRRPNVVLAEHETDPDRRYKMLYVDVVNIKDPLRLTYPQDDLALHVAYSPDGIHWKPQELDKPWVRRSKSGDPQHHPNIMGWDSRISKYVLHPRIFVDGDPKLFAGGLRRAIGRAVSDDFEHWQEEGLVLSPDEHDPPEMDMPGFAAIPYEGIYLGFPYCFHHGEGEKGGHIDTQLVFSRNAVHWLRVADRQVFLETGQPGSFDDWVVTPTTPLIVDDQIWFFYGGWNMGHDNVSAELRHQIFGKMFLGRQMGQAIGLARLRLDGFVSISSGITGQGRVTSKPLVLPPGPCRLQVNADASRGRLAVEILDEHGAPIDGRRTSDCDSFAGCDELRHTVTWAQRSEICPAATPQDKRVVRIRFHLDNAELYSFQLA